MFFSELLRLFFALLAAPAGGAPALAACRHVRVGGGVLGADLDAVGLEIEIATNNISFSHQTK